MMRIDGFEDMITTNDPKMDFAIEVVRAAALLAKEIQRDMTSTALTKDDRSPVTVADFAAQAVVGYHLGKRFPGAALVGEEQADVLRTPEMSDTLEQITRYVQQEIPSVTPVGVCELIDRGVDDPGEVYWTLDPIDGTKGFLRGAQYATALAYVENGIVQIGVLGCPNLSPVCEEDHNGDGALLVAMRERGSWITSLVKTNLTDKYSPLTVSSRTDPKQARLLRSFESDHTNVSQIDLFQKALEGRADPVRMDSQVKYALLAGGKGEIYLRFLSSGKLDYKEKIWDQAAGSLIVEEAGGSVTDLDGRPLDFSQGRTLKQNRGICASNGFLHQQTLTALRTIHA
jgi:3'(2'), 5'-bisphosphate nucleotidase